MSIVRFIDLFAGLGGIRLGFEQAFQEQGFHTHCVLTSEIKPTAIRALKTNFVQDNLVGDIRQVKSENIPDFDFLLGGFPCQAFSTAGKQQGFADTRGTLFFEIERILRDKRPFGFILENVEGLVFHDKKEKEDKIGQTLTTILNKLQSLDYKVSWKVLDCKDFGVPQQRKRIFIVGTLIKKVNLDNFKKQKVILENILEKNQPTMDTDFTRCLFEHFKVEDLYGKAIKDKRGGTNNIHSWDLELKGQLSKEQKDFMNLLLKERRKKHWAEEIGIEWMDGMPLTISQIKTFYNNDNLEIMLNDLVNKGYLVKEFPKKIVLVRTASGLTTKIRKEDITKEQGYNIVAGKLSFEFTQILDPFNISPTIVATDVSHIGIIDNGGIRKLTIREGLRLFGYPEKYNLDIFENEKNSFQKAFDLLGNTVVVPAIKEVCNRITEIYKEEMAKC